MQGENTTTGKQKYSCKYENREIDAAIFHDLIFLFAIQSEYIKGKSPKNVDDLENYQGEMLISGVLFF
jgi:hypothetical protein